MKKILMILMATAMLFSFAACLLDNPVIDVASISLEKELIAINDSSNDYAVKATVFPENATNKDLIYESDNSSILVSQEGIISLETTWSEDKQYFGVITVTSKMNPTVVRYCYVTVNCDEIKNGALSVKLSSESEETVDSVDIYGGQSITPVLVVDSNCEQPEATKLDEMFTITSSDPSIVTVDNKTGKITASDKAGTATVTIESKIPYYDKETKSYVKAKTEYEVCVNPIRTSEQLIAFLSGIAETENPSGVNNQKTAYVALPADKVGLSDVTPVTVNGEKNLDLKDKNIEFKNTDSSVDFIKVATDSKLTIKGTGTISGSSSDDFTLINNEGSLNLEGVALKTDSDTNKKSQIINLGSSYKSFEIKDVDLIANGKSDETTEQSEVYAINSEKTDGSVEIGEDVSISITGGGSAYGIKAKSDVDAVKGLSITIDNAKDSKGIDAGDNDIDLTNGSVTIFSDKDNSTAVALSGENVKVTDGNYDITSKDDSKLIESTVSALLKKLNTNISSNITGGNATIVNGNEGTVTSEGGLYTVTATGDSGVAKGFKTNGNAVLKSVDLSVEGSSAVGAECSDITVENGTYDIEATGTEVATATATAFMLDGSAYLTNPVVKVKAVGAARIADIDKDAGSDNKTKLEVKKGSYNVTSANSDAVAFGSSSDQKGMSIPASFSGEPNVKATAEKGKANAVASHKNITIGHNELNGGFFEAVGNNACVFNLDNVNGTDQNEIEINNVNAASTSSKGEKGSSESCVVYSNNNIIDISGGTYSADGDDLSYTFKLMNNPDSSIGIEKGSATGDTTCCVYAENSDIEVGGKFASEAEETATGIEIKDTSKDKNINIVCKVLENTSVNVKSGQEAYGMCVEEKFNPIEINIEKGLDIEVESTDDSAYGIKLDKDAEKKVNDLKVNIYDGDVNVCASGKDEAIALWNTGELNFENNSDGDVFKGSFEAETDDGIAIGLLNGDFNETNWEAVKNGDTAELEKEGMINVNGESDIKYVATGASGSPVRNYAGDITVFVNNQPISKGDEFMEEYDTGNGSVLSFSNVSQSSSSYVTFTVDYTVNNVDGKRKTYQAPQGTTWYQFINNDRLGQNIMSETKEGKIVNSADLSSSDSRKYYISLNGKAVKSTDDIEDGAEYYYGTPFKLNTAEGTEILYAEKDSTWKEFVKEAYNNYNSDTEFKSFTTIVEGNVMGAGKYHIAKKAVINLVSGELNESTTSYVFVNADEASIEYDGSYYVVLEFKATPSSGKNSTVFIEKNAKWGNLTAFNASGSIYASYLGEDYIAYKDGDDYKFVKKSDKVNDSYNYEVVVKFSLTTYNGHADVTTEYVRKGGTSWNDFMGEIPALEAISDNNGNYNICYGSAGPKVCTSNAEPVKKSDNIKCKDYWTVFTVKYYSSPIDSTADTISVIAGKTIPSSSLILNGSDKISGSTLGGWYTSDSYAKETKYDFDLDRVDSYLSLYAKQYFNLKLIYILNTHKDYKSHVNNVYSQYWVEHIYGVDTPLLTVSDKNHMASIAPGHSNNEVFAGWTLREITDEIEDGSAYTSVMTSVISKTHSSGGSIYVYALWIEWNGKFYEYGTEPDINT